MCRRCHSSLAKNTFQQIVNGRHASERWEVTNWAHTSCGKCVGHLRRPTHLRLNFAAPLIGQPIGCRPPTPLDRAWPRARPRRLEFAPARPPPRPSARSQSPRRYARPATRPLATETLDWQSRSASSTIGSIHFGFWFRTRACGSGCRSLAKQLARRGDTHKAAVSRQILGRRWVKC
jgi:hypothetical protein